MYTGGETTTCGDIQVVVAKFKGGWLVYRIYEIQWPGGRGMQEG